MPRRKQTCPKRMKYDGKEPPEGEVPAEENGDAGSDSNCSGEEEEDEEEGGPTEQHSKDDDDEGDDNDDDGKAQRETTPEYKASPLPPPPPPVTEASILDKLTSFTNGNGGGGAATNNNSSSKSTAYASPPSSLAAPPSLGSATEESAISKLSNFVKDPGKLLSKTESVSSVRVPRSVKVPTPPSLPAAYQQYIAAAAAAVSSSYMLAAPLPTASSPSPSDQDLPLDLSVKTKGLDLSTKSSSKSSSLAALSSSSNKYISPPPPSKSRVKDTGSSLKSLEQKFGSNAFPFESRGSGLKSHMYRHPLMPAFGGNLYTSALFNTQTLASTDLVYKPEHQQYQQQQQQQHLQHQQQQHHRDQARHSPRRESRSEKSKSANSHPTPKSSSSSAAASTAAAASVSSTASVTTSSTSPSSAAVVAAESMAAIMSTAAAAAIVSPNNKDKRHTTLLCKCGKDYLNLYDLTVHLRETGHSPNDKGGVQPEYPKLVRGQDMWLNQGSEQTRQILRCMQCGESFKSLPELTVHMIETKHYTNIVGTDTSTLSRKVLKLGSSDSGSDSEVFKCQVCDMTYENMEGLTGHMMNSGHHKRPVIIQPESPKSPSKTPTPTAPSGSPKPRAASPMSLSLMEYKYKLAKLAAEHSSRVAEDGSRDSSSPGSDFLAEISKITCETCGDRIEMGKFVEHVRACVGKRSHIKHKPNGIDMSALSPGKGKKRKLEEGEIDRHEEDRYATPSPVPIKKERGSTDSPSVLKSEADSSDTHAISASEKPLPPLPSTPVSTPTSSSTTNGPNEASALKAMESFIERSFTSVTSHLRSRYFPFKGPVRNTFISDLPDSRSDHHHPHHHHPHHRSTADSTATNSSGVGSSSLAAAGKYSNKYLPPLYMSPEPKAQSAATAVPKSEHDSKVAIKRKNSNSSRSPTPPVKIKKEKEDVCSPKTSPSPPSAKYIQEEEVPTSNGTEGRGGGGGSGGESKSSVSALESLQGLVYGKSFNSEHPLDSLQKLLHTTHTPGGTPHAHPSEAHLKQNGTLVNSSSMATTPRKPTPPVVAVANVTLLPASASSPLRAATPSAGSPSPRAASSPAATGPNTAAGPAVMSPQPPRSDGEDDGGEGGEYECAACKRLFVSRGAYRYHATRCHLKSNTGDHTNSSPVASPKQQQPYVYLPLDHTAKFTKYYEMANELANKTK